MAPAGSEPEPIAPGAGDARRVLALLPRERPGRGLGRRGRDQRDPRRRERRGVPRAGTRAPRGCRSACSAASRRRATATWRPSTRDAARRLRARPRRRLAAARARRGPADRRHGLLARSGTVLHERALPAAQRSRQTQAAGGAARARRGGARGRAPGSTVPARRRGAAWSASAARCATSAAAAQRAAGLPSNGVQGMVIDREALDELVAAARRAAGGRARERARGSSPRAPT